MNESNASTAGCEECGAMLAPGSEEQHRVWHSVLHRVATAAFDAADAQRSV